MQKKRTWNFGQLEAALAELNLVIPEKRTAFQSRLKNFHRLGFPPEFAATKGKAAAYSAGQVYDMALAVELTQLGLSPDRVVTILGRNRYEIAMAAKLGASSLIDWRSNGSPEDSPPLQMYIYFDPEALETLMNRDDEDEISDLTTFFYGGHGVMAEMLARFEPGNSPRLSIVNVTSLIAALDIQMRNDLVSGILEWAGEVELAPESKEARLVKLKQARQAGLRAQEFDAALRQEVGDF